jgi:hypothetical protein
MKQQQHAKVRIVSIGTIFILVIPKTVQKGSTLAVILKIYLSVYKFILCEPTFFIRFYFGMLEFVSVKIGWSTTFFTSTICVCPKRHGFGV